jgi:hypothetical protein
MRDPFIKIGQNLGLKLGAARIEVGQFVGVGAVRSKKYLSKTGL